MGIIKRSYSTRVFSWPIEKDRKFYPYVSWSSQASDPLVVYHPYLLFDPISKGSRMESVVDRRRRIFLHPLMDYTAEKYIPRSIGEIPIKHCVYKVKVKANPLGVLETFLSMIEQSYRLTDDSWLWNDTGYWSGFSDNKGFIGLGEKSAAQLYKSGKEIKLCYVVSCPSTILVFTLASGIRNEFELDAYHSNKFIPFPELVSSIESSLSRIGKWDSILAENHTDDVVFHHKKAQRDHHRDCPFKVSSVKPEFVVPTINNPRIGENDYYAIVLKNKIFFGKECSLPQNGYFIASRGDYWMESLGDFSQEKRYSAGVLEMRKLRTCSLVSIHLELQRDGDELLGDIMDIKQRF